MRLGLNYFPVRYLLFPLFTCGMTVPVLMSLFNSVYVRVCACARYKCWTGCLSNKIVENLIADIDESCFRQLLHPTFSLHHFFALLSVIRFNSLFKFDCNFFFARSVCFLFIVFTVCSKNTLFYTLTHYTHLYI